MALFGYGLFQARNLIAGPQITVFEPGDGVSITRQIIEIRGQVKNTSKMTVNDREVLTEEGGDFREKLVLSEGYNIILISAWDRFGRMESKKVELVFNGESETGIINTQLPISANVEINN